MSINTQDMFFNRTALHSMSIPWGFHYDHCEASLTDSYGVSFHFDSASCWDSRYSGHFSCLPFQNHFGLCNYSMEPAFIRKRNERERQRVRCVNEGYTRLRQHLPEDLVEKRLSKVETLRAAIGYIKRLQGLLDLEALRSPLEDAQLHPHLNGSMMEESRPAGFYVNSPQKEKSSQTPKCLKNFNQKWPFTEKNGVLLKKNVISLLAQPKIALVFVLDEQLGLLRMYLKFTSCLLASKQFTCPLNLSFEKLLLPN